MRSAVIGLLAETSIHPGTGRSTGVVDLPVAREAATDYPFIAGSSLKGALRDQARQHTNNNENFEKEIFGAPDEAGALLVSDARLLLLPVRSLTGAYRWATCPLLIERYQRDLRRAGVGPLPPVPTVGPLCALAAGEEHLFLEEREFRVTGAPDPDLIKALEPLIAHEETRRRLPRQLVVLDDNDFAWFARYGLPIQARNQLDKGTKTSKNLWFEESIPPDTLMYALIVERREGALGALSLHFPAGRPYLQAGGNETVGQGWFAVTVRQSDAAAKGGGAA